MTGIKKVEKPSWFYEVFKRKYCLYEGNPFIKAVIIDREESF